MVHPGGLPEKDWEELRPNRPPWPTKAELEVAGVEDEEEEEKDDA